MRILILSSNNGGGHNTAARAILEAAQEQNISCDMMDGLSFAGQWKSKIIEEFYIKSTLYTPTVISKSNDWLEDHPIAGESLCYRANARYADELAAYLENRQVDAVICTHVFSALAMTEVRRHWLHHFPTFFTATDYHCVSYLEETEMDGYFIPHADLRPAFTRERLPHVRLFSTGIPVARKFTCRTERSAARLALGLPTEPQAVLIMTGSMGYGDIPAMLLELQRAVSKDTLLLVMGGNNEKLKETLRAEFSPCENVRIIDFTKEVELYMDAADVLITKPGGLSTTEATVHGIPLVLSTPIPGWEEENAAFFKAKGMALYQPDPVDAAKAAVQLLADPEARAEMVARQHAEIPQRAADEILRVVKQTLRPNAAGNL